MKVTFGKITQLDTSLLPKKIAIITDKVVEKLYAENFCAFLKHQGKHPLIISFPAGEAYKTRATKEFIEDTMQEQGFGRDCAVIGMGGGVVTDIAGFVAATYCRGVSLFLIPTTLTAMVDAAIGGKSAVNTPLGKNSVGSFYDPLLTFIDKDYLSSLPLSELKNGVIEMLKHGLIANEKYFHFLVENAEAVLQLDRTVLTHALERGIAIKQIIVKQDPREIGQRRVLNFGHTIGHAIEQSLNYTISHGKAVAIGILGETQLSMISEREKEAIQAALHRYQFFPSMSLDANAVLAAMKLDKKSSLGSPRFVLLETIGKPAEYQGAYCTHVDMGSLQETLNWLCNVVRCH